MNRRSFLKLFSAGLPATVVAEKIGLIEKARKYFFAPKGGWQPSLAIRPGDLIFTDTRGLWVGQEFPIYAPDGRLARAVVRITSFDQVRGIVTIDHVVHPNIAKEVAKAAEFHRLDNFIPASQLLG